DYAIVASWGGSDTHPHWYLNLRANPHVLVEDHGRRVEALASTVDDDATYDRLWQRFVEIYPGYEMYKSRTTRRIPIVRLRPYDKRQPAAG
ncbi:MAG TPA: nitroreductase/quinone reductase family protein, partial [Roseiflexaceae bacterium]|nr:nitroreductase/quinone reductase family protein [Roseiflexaceae bacterium]